MWIKISKDLRVDSRTLIRLEWRNFLPVLIVHERFENKIKWILRIIAIIGIGTSVISIPQWYFALGLAIFIFMVEQFFEKTIFEYTIMVVQPPPGFQIDYSQWKTNGFMIPQKKYEGELSHFGPAYTDRDYAIKFFEYLKAWNWGQDIDKQNNIVISFVIEPNEKYTTYLYANPGRKNLSKMFEAAEEANRFDKYGKNAQHFFMQMVFWHTLPFKEGYFIKQFLAFQNPDDQYYLTPSVLSKQEGQPPEFIFESSIFKFGYQLKHRHELTKFDTEYYHPPSD